MQIKMRYSNTVLITIFFCIILDELLSFKSIYIAWRHSVLMVSVHDSKLRSFPNITLCIPTAHNFIA